MTVVLVEGESDAVAVTTLARRLGMPVPRVLPVGGSKGARRAVEQLVGEQLVGLVDAAERRDFERVQAPVRATAGRGRSAGPHTACARCTTGIPHLTRAARGSDWCHGSP
ncbi:hypothetical protein GCM10022382_20180 [Microbacterium invictum]